MLELATVAIAYKMWFVAVYLDGNHVIMAKEMPDRTYCNEFIEKLPKRNVDIGVFCQWYPDDEPPEEFDRWRGFLL